MGTITSANSILTLGVASVYPTAQQIQGYQMDDAFAFEAVEPAQMIIGVDGLISAGYIPTLKKSSLMIQADSPSIAIFETWSAAMDQALEIYFAFASLAIPSLGTAYALTQGVLTSYVPAPSAKKVMQGRTFGITWGSILPQPT